MEAKQERHQSIQELNQIVKTKVPISSNKVLKTVIQGVLLLPDTIMNWHLNPGDRVNVYDDGDKYLICKSDAFIPWEPRNKYWFKGYVLK